LGRGVGEVGPAWAQRLGRQSPACCGQLGHRAEETHMKNRGLQLQELSGVNAERIGRACGREGRIHEMQSTPSSRQKAAGEVTLAKTQQNHIPTHHQIMYCKCVISELMRDCTNVAQYLVEFPSRIHEIALTRPDKDRQAKIPRAAGASAGGKAAGPDEGGGGGRLATCRSHARV
jgi:hypothetical protein